MSTDSSIKSWVSENLINSIIGEVSIDKILTLKDADTRFPLSSESYWYNVNVAVSVNLVYPILQSILFTSINVI